MTVDELLEKLLQRAARAFAEDPSSPGIHASKLPNGSYYASVKRYLWEYGRGQEIVAAERAGSLAECLERLLERLECDLPSDELEFPRGN